MDHSRRKFLKVMAAAPALLIAGMSVPPILRFLKPTMGPMGFFEPADIPSAESTLTFPTNYFREPWVWFPFMFPLKIAEFNPEQKEVREIPGLAVKLPNNEIVAYSRVCPYSWEGLRSWIAFRARTLPCWMLFEVGQMSLCG